MDGLIAYALAKKAISISMGDIGTNLTYRGSVSSVDDLPSGAQAGDMYGVGTEGLYAWNGSAWGAISRMGVHGQEGFSPIVTITSITGGHRVTITDADGDHTFDVMDGQGGSGGTSDFEQLSNRPKYNGGTMDKNTNIPEVKTETWGSNPASSASTTYIISPTLVSSSSFVTPSGSSIYAGKYEWVAFA